MLSMDQNAVGPLSAPVVEPVRVVPSGRRAGTVRPAGGGRPKSGKGALAELPRLPASAPQDADSSLKLGAIHTRKQGISRETTKTGSFDSGPRGSSPRRETSANSTHRPPATLVSKPGEPAAGRRARVPRISSGDATEHAIAAKEVATSSSSRAQHRRHRSQETDTSAAAHSASQPELPVISPRLRTAAVISSHVVSPAMQKLAPSRPPATSDPGLPAHEAHTHVPPTQRQFGRRHDAAAIRSSAPIAVRAAPPASAPSPPPPSPTSKPLLYFPEVPVPPMAALVGDLPVTHTDTTHALSHTLPLSSSATSADPAIAYSASTSALSPSTPEAGGGPPARRVPLAPSALRSQAARKAKRASAAAAAASHAATEAACAVVNDPEHTRLSQQWVEVEMMLRVRITTQEDVALVIRDVDDSLTYLDRLAATATRLSCTQGALSRVLLPFDTYVETYETSPFRNSLCGVDLCCSKRRIYVTSARQG